MTPTELAALQLDSMAAGDLAGARRCIHPEHVNHMAVDEPPACALPGVPGFMATSAWLRMAFTDLRFEIIEMAHEGDRAIVHAYMRGRHTGPFVVFPPGRQPVSFPPTRREFGVRHAHVLRLRDSLVLEHTAVRDDLGMMTQLGHLPPSPRAAARMAWWGVSGGGRRSIAEAVGIARIAANEAAAANGATVSSGTTRSSETA